MSKRPAGQGKPKKTSVSPIEKAYRELRLAAEAAGEKYDGVREHDPYSEKAGPQTPILRAAAIVRGIAITDAGRDTEKDVAHADHVHKLTREHKRYEADLKAEIRSMRLMLLSIVDQRNEHYARARLWERRAKLWALFGVIGCVAVALGAYL